MGLAGKAAKTLKLGENAMCVPARLHRAEEAIIEPAIEYHQMHVCQLAPPSRS